MDCVKSFSKTKKIQLLNQSDKAAFLETEFSRYKQKSDIFIPDASFYKPTAAPEDVQQMSDAIFKWLNIKHRSVTFNTSHEHQQYLVYTKKGAHSTITINNEVLDNTLLLGAVLAHGIAHHLLVSRSKVSIQDVGENEALTDLATIQLGLGILVLNGLNQSVPMLGYMAPDNYVAECLDFFKERRIVPSIWQPSVISPVLEQYILEDKSTVKVSLKRARIAKASLMICAVLMVIGTVFFINANKPKYLPAELTEKKEEIQIIKNQYQICIDEVKRKQQNWNTSDIFMQRQIDADKSRCTSIKNRYNYEVNQYNNSF